MTFILFILVFGAVVIAHEFGHYILARANGIRVLEFSIGMGPKIFKHQGKNTLFTIRLLPLGGACMFENELELPTDKKNEDGTPEEEKEPAPEIDRAVAGYPFNEANVWSRIATVVAGPIFNFILAILTAFIMVNTGMCSFRDAYIQEIDTEGAAYEAGLRAGDVILSIEGERMYMYEELQLFTTLYNGKESALVEYQRDGSTYTATVYPKYSQEYGKYMFGISNADYKDASGRGSLKNAWYLTRYYVKVTYKSLGAMLKGNVSRQDVSGPVGVAVNVVGKTYEAAKEYGWQTVVVSMLNIILMLSVNLGILNLLPLPALDGGRLVFLLWEAITRKPVPPEKEGMVHFIGIIFFMILMVLIFFNDLVNIFG